MKRIVWFVIAVLGATACSELSSAPVPTHRVAPGSRSADMITCWSGYVVAYRSDGTAYCAPDSTSTTSATTASPSSTTSTAPSSAS